jgi:SAM-dependent methyltransferase
MTPLPPWLYQLVGHVVAPGAKHQLRAVLAQWRKSHPAPGPSLDVGCGTRSWLHTIGLQPLGVDVDARRVAVFARRHGQAVQASATALPFADGGFDSVWCFGLLHHLSHDDARRAVREMRRVTRCGGYTIVFDGVWPRASWQRPVATWLRRLDHGGWMRSQDELERLLAPFGNWERNRLTYSLTGLEGVLFTQRIGLPDLKQEDGLGPQVLCPTLRTVRPS